MHGERRTGGTRRLWRREWVQELDWPQRILGLTRRASRGDSAVHRRRTAHTLPCRSPKTLHRVATPPLEPARAILPRSGSTAPPLARQTASALTPTTPLSPNPHQSLHRGTSATSPPARRTSSSRLPRRSRTRKATRDDGKATRRLLLVHPTRTGTTALPVRLARLHGCSRTRTATARDMSSMATRRGVA